MDERSEKIRALNDELRTTRKGGRIHISKGVALLSEEIVTEVLEAVSAFSNFTSDTDPYGEHDGAGLHMTGFRVLWMIDYYDKDLKHGSPDPTDPSVTERVLTIMLAEEY